MIEKFIVKNTQAKVKRYKIPAPITIITSIRRKKAN
jgi:hypothetical protein